MAFFRKKKQPQLMLKITRGEQEVFSGPARDYPFEEAVLKTLAIAYYNDPAPCEIRRAAVRSRIWMEMQPMVPLNAPAESLPQAQQAYFPQGTVITLRYEEP